MSKQRIVPCLWFADEAEEAARFYCGVFKNSRITSITRYGKAGFETHHRPAGSVMTVAFELDGQPYTALNGGPVFTFNEAVSLQVMCKNQEEIDYYWDKLGAGGDPKAQICGWLKDKFGLSWQIVPAIIGKMITDPDKAKRDRVMAVVMKSKKLNIAELRAAYEGKRAA